MPIEVLFVDDEEHLRIAAAQTLELAGYQALTKASAQDALMLISRSYRGVLVSDIRMPGMGGMQLLREAIAIDPELPVILVTGHGDVNLAVEAMRVGAYDFIEKPFTTERFLESIARARVMRALTLENRGLRDSISNQPDDLENRLAGRAPEMCSLRKKIRAVASTPADVLFVGETGTGKEISARAIHDLSPQRDKPFIVIDCAALSSDMIDAELFGYEAGAFNGATRARFGKFEHARNGTIYFDNAQSMSRELQAKLLRVIQERQITRLGGNEPIKLNCRFIAASSIELEEGPFPNDELVFSKDLLYRLNAVTLRLPPLSERREDIPVLFRLLVTEAATRLRCDVPQPASDVYMSELINRDWPGNVRELRNAAERHVLGIDETSKREVSASESLKYRVAAFERQAIETELRAQNGNLKAVYEALGLSRKTLYEKMQKFGLSRVEFRK